VCKGRDLGFGTILNFQTKIGTGMGEQMLSREYYYLGTQLPWTASSPYYGHPGFHINNILVMMSVQIFMLTLIFLGTLNWSVRVCQYDAEGQYPPGQSGCYNLQPVFKWIKRCIISIFIVFWIAFVPCSSGAHRAWNRPCDHPSRQALRFAVAGLRGLLDADLHALDHQQLDLRRCSLHCHRPWFRHHSHLVQHPLLAFRRPRSTLVSVP
jgi:hypothetical protein